MNITKNVPFYLEMMVTDETGNTVTGLSVTYYIYKCEDNSLISSGLLNDLGNGIYQKEYILGDIGQYRIMYFPPSEYSKEIETFVVCEEIAKESSLQIVKEIVELVRQAEFGRWKIDATNKQLIFYKEDNVTEIARFDLFDLENNKAITNVIERKRV